MPRTRTFGQVQPVEKIWLTNSEAASYLGVSTKTLDRLRTTAKLSYYKPGGTVIYRKRDLDNLVKRNRVI